MYRRECVILLRVASSFSEVFEIRSNQPPPSDVEGGGTRFHVERGGFFKGALEDVILQTGKGIARVQATFLKGGETTWKSKLHT